ncbi:Rrf2 family protein [Hamadaea flava]|uniref:RrF2 family transcriptional regulator n=1 Tax=Hamadaea flava TaxID=1742688 RepID=A0ABV8M2J8_9ACTN|nr:Rrf2 family transcriptional regulator [Hamadaea flava]MCP2326940.1 Rrf2 family protein [Hamadaea flava]
MSEGVEWAVHSCLNLTWLPSGQAVPAAKLAAFYGLPAAYLNKQLQALARAGIVTSTSGPRGGFQLARSPETITLLDIVVAIEGADAAFRCEQLLKEGPGADPTVDYRQSCLVSQAMSRADLAWRKELAGQTLAGLKAQVEQRYPATPGNTVNRFTALRA